MTYSIIARDERTGELGGAVQSCFFAAGVVLHAEPGIGVIASQAIPDPEHRPLGLAMLRESTGATEVLRTLVERDDLRDLRQLGVLDATGRCAAHTGALCVAEAGHLLGDGFSVQANMMERSTVPAAMAEAFESADGDLPTRLLAALDAAQREGGDFRGQQAAGMLVVTGEPGEHPGSTVVDVRVDDSEAPLDELRRLVELAHGYRVFGQALEHIGALDIDAALDAAAEAARLLPHALDPTLLRAGLLAASGDVDAARATVEGFGGDQARVRLALQRFAATGLIPVAPEVVEALTTWLDDPD